MLAARLRSDPRTPEQIREHYQLERALASRLRNAGREERRQLYGPLYDELFRCLPHHPLLRRKADPEETRKRTGWKLALLSRFLGRDTVYVEIGPGDCSLAVAVAGRVRRAYAVDISAEITRRDAWPENLTLALSDGVSVPVPEGSATVVYSDQLMEHLHPDDAREQLRHIHRALAPGGIYLCVTPNRLSGPHDVSRYYDREATGFHLREYSLGELEALFSEVGFGSFVAYAGGRGYYLRVPDAAVRVAEWTLERLPYRLRRPLARSVPGQALLGVALAARKLGG